MLESSVCKVTINETSHAGCNFPKITICINPYMSRIMDALKKEIDLIISA
jgi:hypothetical protein